MAKKIVILGGGISGYGSAILAKKKGFDVFLSDSGTIKDIYRKRLEEWNVEYEQGGHSIERILSADIIVKSPGIPEKNELIQKLRAKSIPIISEMEFAYPYIGKAKCICITGSNGKTTTTSLIYKILKDAGYKVALGGNIGESFAYTVATEEVDWYVLELSSFQLDGMFRFRAHIAILMNITPDHLDRYGYVFQNYVDSKMRIIQNQKSNDFFIYSADDNVIQAELKKRTIPAKELPFMAHNTIFSQEGDAMLHATEINVSVNKKDLMLDCSQIQIKGLHNSYNTMAAALAALAAKVKPSQIKKSIYDFSPVEHRLEPAGEYNGIKFINDSKATNVDSVWYALEAMQTPVVWIAGGTDKGNDYSPLKEFARQKIHTLVCMGLDNKKLLDEFEGIIPNIISTSSLDDAMNAATKAARPQDTVLLSPACASFDLFKCYEDRGEQFKRWVEKLIQQNKQLKFRK
ncbi:MAG: UDP-N-acetylmuramoyl-L-alanine--D-glutamate ligase [Alistipes sp.]|nr:UDP-N-acetylmuramoyl-L-alanine--D-glutamate ligase [Candidatus Alistipes equi]